MKKHEWKYDEYVLSGTDFHDIENVREYDAMHSSFRDYDKEAEEILEALQTGPESEIIDLGCGTGTFTVNAARKCKKVHAVDISDLMLRYSAEKARKAGVGNIEFHKGGFLSYEHRFEPVDAVVSSLVLHHLPDFWKQIALQRVCSFLKPGGRFFLLDVVFSFPTEEYEKIFDTWVDGFREKLGDDFAAKSAGHLKREYSTFDWVMNGMLERAGFTVEYTTFADGMMAKYICTKKVSG